jgi:hypothetical protein
MPISSEDSNPQKANDAISINQNGEVVIKDKKLAEALQELSPEELDAVAGGAASKVLETCTSNKNC